MRLSVLDEEVIVVLSRSNLVDLLHKLDGTGDFARTIVKDCGSWLLVVRAEHDDEHYEGVQRGTMHPRIGGYIGRRR